MKRIETSIMVGLVLIGAGVLFLLQNLGVLGPVGNVVWALLCLNCAGISRRLGRGGV